MNKWRLLLFSVFGLLQITTSDRNFIDGRDRCCHHLPHSKSDKRISLYEPFRGYSLLPELRQLKSPERSRSERDQEHRRSSYRPHINYREEHWRDSTSRRDENRRAVDHQRIRDNEVQDILRARTNRQKLSSVALRDSYRQNEARIERSENRYVRLYTRETFQRNAREDFNIGRESFERKGKVPTRFTDRDTMSTDTVSARQNRKNRQNARQILFVRDDHEDLERRAQYFDRREVSDATRNEVNNLEERVRRLRTRRNSLKEPRQTKEFRSRFRATHAYENMAIRDNVRIVRDSRNREEALNVNLRALRESHTQTEGNSRLMKRSVSDEMVRDESNIMNNREYRYILRQRSSRISETNRDIRLGRQNEEKSIHEYTDSRSNKGDFSRLTSNNLNIRSSNDENQFERDTRMRVSDQKLKYTLRNDNNNRDNKRQVLREINGQRNKIDIMHRDTSNIIEKHIQIDGFRHNRDSRDIRSERSTEERTTVRNDNGQRRGSVRAQAMDETRIRSNNRANIYHNQRDTNEAVRRSRSQRLINSRRTERSRIEERSMRQTAKDTSLDRNNENDVAQVLQRRRARSMQERLAIKLDNRDVSEYERRSRNSQERYRSVVQDSRSNSDEETQRIRPQASEGRNLVQHALNKLIRRTNVQNIRDTSDNYLHRIRSRNLEEKFSITPQRDQIRNRDIRNNEISRERKLLRVQKRSTKRHTTDESRIRSPSLPMNNDVQNFRYNVDEEFRRMRSQDLQERINGQRVSDFRIVNVDIRDEVLTSLRFRIMQERLSNNRNRQGTGIRINNVRKALDNQHIRDNRESRQQRPRIMEERRSSKAQNMIVIVRTVDEEARRIQSRNQETNARQVMDKSKRITNVPNNRSNIDRMRLRNMQERANRDETRIVVERSEIRKIRNNDEDRQTGPATERFTDIKRAEIIREKRQFNEDNQRTDMRRMITLARENRSRTIYRDIDNKKSGSSVFEMKWQYLFYAMQAIYLCSLFIKISKDEESKKKPRMNNWLTPMDMKID